MRPTFRWGGVILVVLLAVAAGAAAFHYVPFDGASYAAWAGIALALVGFVSVARPLRFLGVRTRGLGLLVVAGGVVLAVGAIVWPASVVQSPASSVKLDDFLPEYQFSEYHEGRTRAPVARVIEAARQVSVADMPVAVFLMRLRDMAVGHFAGPAPDTRPILEVMIQPGTGFLALDVSNPAEIVYGMVGRPWTNEAPPQITTPAAFLAFASPGQIRVAFDIRVVDEGNGVVRVSTETRSLGNDAEARRMFARYWRVIYPGSAIIRRVWLDAIIARAEREDAP